MKIKYLYYLSVTIACFTLSACQKARTEAVAATESTYAKVIRTGTIRAGYLVYPPGCIKDPNTGKVSGIHIETLEQVAHALGLHVEWIEASGWGSMIEDVKQKKIDMMGSPVWANSTRAKHVAFSKPLFWSGICLYARADDARFSNPSWRDQADAIRFTTIDGEMSAIIANSDFPKSPKLTLPQNADNSLMLENITSDKADATFVEPYIAALFLKNKPGTLKNYTPDKPIRVFPNCWMLPIDDPQLKAMLDTALDELVNSGLIDELIVKYAGDRSLFYPVAHPYRVPNSR